MQLVLYIATLLGAFALVLMMPKRSWNLPRVGALLGAATLGGAWVVLASYDAGGNERHGLSAMTYYYVFSFIAIAAAARVITHTRPVYSALWFIMVVLASAGLFLSLAAEFMALAMIIIYAGAILVTYMFVIMLATQAEDPDFTGPEPDASHYDRVALEPVAAAAAGFLLLAVVLTAAFEPMEPNPAAAGVSDEVIASTLLAGRAEVLANIDQPSAVTNVSRVGLSLFTGHPLGLELAGVILLVALIGAVVIARTRVPSEQTPGTAAADPATGATVHPTREPGPDEPEAIGEVGGRLGA